MVKPEGEEAEYDRAEALKRFDSTKAGVKGQVDSGVTAIPPIFFHPPETLSTLKPRPQGCGAQPGVPVIDVSGPRAAVINQLRDAATDPGIFQIVGHGIPAASMARARAAVKAFHELPEAARAEFYGEKFNGGGRTGSVKYRSNFDLFVAKVASWHDTIRISLAPDRAITELIPEVMREVVEEWDREVSRFGEVLVGLLGEGLGLSERRLRGMTIGERRVLVGHYYPFCPQPDRTMGLAAHADPTLLTVLLQDHVGGLQIKTSHGAWIDVDPIPGALVINVGDLFQILSNNTYRSVEHRVLANPGKEPRVSVVVFLNPTNRSGFFGPLPELVGPQNPAFYRQMTYQEYIDKFSATQLDGQFMKNHFKIVNN